MDPALISYIREARAAGFTDDQIVEELRGVGWGEAAIKEAISVSTLQSFVGPPVPYTPRPDNPVVRFLHNAGRSLWFKVGSVVLGLAFIGAGAYAGWRYYDSLPAKALTDMPRKMAELKSASYRAQLRIRLASPSQKTAVNPAVLAYVEPNSVQIVPKEFENAQIEWRMSGAYATRPEAPADFSALLDFALEMSSQTVAVSVEFRQVAGTWYVRLLKLPTELLGEFAPEERSILSDVGQYLNKWYSFRPDSLKKYLPTYEAEPASSGFALNPVKEKQIKGLIASANLYHIQSVTRTETVDGAGVYRYLVDLLAENSLALVREVSAAFNDRSLTKYEEDQLRNVLAQFAKAKVQLWVGRKDHLLRRSHVSLEDFGFGDYKLPTEINFDLADFNRVTVATPEGATPLEELIDRLLETSRRQARDSKRLADLRQIQLALELFADSHQLQYPRDIYSFAPCGRGSACGLSSPDACGSTSCIASVPVDPLDERPYLYNYHLTRRTVDAYHLGASFEDSANAALESDRDCDSITGENCPFRLGWEQLMYFDGLDSHGCFSESGRACYDVTN